MINYKKFFLCVYMTQIFFFFIEQKLIFKNIGFKL